MIQHSRVTRVRGEWKEYLASGSLESAGSIALEAELSYNSQRIAESR